MTVNEIRQKYFDFYTEREHTVIPSAPLLPENDPTTLFTGSGMQPLLPYLLGQSHPKGGNIVDSQKCFRAEDIEEVGDNRHTTFFEMLGNWSLGTYFKAEQLPWVFSFLTDELGIDPSRLYVTVFSGDAANTIPRDEESVRIWKELFSEKGVTAETAEMITEEKGGKRGMQEGERIFFYDASKNWWSRAGVPDNMPAGEPGGPDSEIFFDFGTAHDPAFGEHCHPNCDCGRFLEIGNSVFMEYLKQEDGSFAPLPQKNVDFGGGLERIAAAVNDTPDVFQIDALRDVIAGIETATGKTYAPNTAARAETAAFRIVADHLRGAVFMIADGVSPSNTDAGYVLRRLIRRSVQHIDALGAHSDTLHTLIEPVVQAYADAYPAIADKKETINTLIQGEESKFRQTLEKGMKEIEKVIPVGIIDERHPTGSGSVAGHVEMVLSGEKAFELYATYGFPIEMTQELANARGYKVDMEAFQEKMEQHRKQSRAGAEQKFKGGLADTGEITTQLHTATHLLLAGLRKYLGEDVHQAGSNITAERTRFDFTYPEKVDRETLDKVEAYVNDAIAAKAERTIEEMDKEAAKAAGVEGSFWDRYPDVVNVYTFKSADGTVWSQELCGGPHVDNTGDIAGTFRIKKEESVAQGVRRVKAILA